MKPRFTPGKNIAIKVPAHEYEDTVVFYRDILGFEQIPASSSENIAGTIFRFGDKNLWVDKIPGISQAEIWLEVITDELDMAAEYLHDKHCNRTDEIEPLPDNVKGFLASSPSSIIHLINQADPWQIVN
jgi:hypothetical protein